MEGRAIGNYRVLGELGRGGMGTVYEAEHTIMGRRAAIKILAAKLSEDHGMVQRFFNEARAAATIKHPGIVEVLDVGYLDDGLAYLIMERLVGEPLSDRMARGQISADELANIIAQLTASLSAAHRHGIVHRDLKPDNIFLCTDREAPAGVRVKVLDFGIAKLHGDLAAGVATKTGSLMGTPFYMSPEQCRGAGEVDIRSDIYSLGCILYEMLAGNPPFVAAGLGDVLAAHIYKPAVDVRELVPGVPEPVAAVAMAALAKDASERPQTMADFASALAVREGNPAPARPQQPAPTPPSAVAQPSVAAVAPPAPPQMASQPVGGPMQQHGSAATMPGSQSPAPPRPGLGAPEPASKRGIALGVGVTLAVVASAGFLAIRGDRDEPSAKPTAFKVDALLTDRSYGCGEGQYRLQVSAPKDATVTVAGEVLASDQGLAYRVFAADDPVILSGSVEVEARLGDEVDSKSVPVVSKPRPLGLRLPRETRAAEPALSTDVTIYPATGRPITRPYRRIPIEKGVAKLRLEGCDIESVVQDGKSWSPPQSQWFELELDLTKLAKAATSPATLKNASLDVEVVSKTGEKARVEVRATLGPAELQGLLKELAAVENGPVPWAAPAAPGPRPVAVVLRTGERLYGPDLLLGLKTLGEVQLVAVQDNTSKKTSRCGPYYGGNKSYFERTVVTSKVNLYEASTGKKIASKSFRGRVPSCPPTKAGDWAISGNAPKNKITAWLRQKSGQNKR